MDNITTTIIAIGLILGLITTIIVTKDDLKHHQTKNAIQTGLIMGITVAFMWPMLLTVLILLLIIGGLTFIITKTIKQIAN